MNEKIKQFIASVGVFVGDRSLSPQDVVDALIEVRDNCEIWIDAIEVDIAADSVE